MTILVGRQVPDFTAAAVLQDGTIDDKFQLSKALTNKYGLLFFYPLDFTFVCPSELIALDKRLQEFTKRQVEVITISVDSQFAHIAWRNTPVAKGGIGPVKYTMVADVSHQICSAFGVEHPEAKVAFRGCFIVDKNGIVRAQLINDLPLGRNVDELLRLVDALQFHETNGEVCPAGWNKGKPGIIPSESGIVEYLAANAQSL